MSLGPVRSLAWTSIFRATVRATVSGPAQGGAVPRLCPALEILGHHHWALATTLTPS